MKVFVIVVTYNGAADIPEFIDTFKRYTPGDEVELVVVDNSSTDDSVSLVQRLAPFAHLIQQKGNAGFTGGNNIGMAYSLEHGAEQIMLVNQDIRFAPHWLAPLRTILEKNPAIGAVQPKLMLYPQTDTINSCGNALHFLGFGFTRGYQKKEADYSCEDVVDVAYCSFSAVMLSCVALRRVGLFDESLFMYHEDSDLCWRMRLAGYRCIVACQPRLYHRYEFSRSIAKFYYIERNRIQILLKNYSLRTIVLIAPMFFFWEAGLIAYSVVGLLFWRKSFGIREKARAYAYFFSFRAWRVLLRNRRIIQSSRIISDRDIARLFTALIEFQDVDNPLLRNVANPMTNAYWRLIRKFI